MNNVTVLAIFIILSSVVYSQDNQKQVSRIDSLINEIESAKNIIHVRNCDTSAIWETGYFSIYCEEFHHRDNKLLKAVVEIRTIPIPELPLKKGQVFRYQIFYFQNDKLIKFIQKDSVNSKTPVYEFDYTSESLSNLESIKSTDPDKYRKAMGYKKFGDFFLTRYKENRLD